MRRLIFAVMTAVWFSPAVPAAVAAPPDYLVDTWDTENGLPSSTVTAIAQTPDGYLWVGTTAGLARFDGVRFVTYDPASQPALTQARIQGLYLDVNGTLWINTFRGGLTSYRNGEFRNELPDQPGFDLHTILVASSPKRVTFVTQSGDVLQRDPTGTNASWRVTPPPAGSRPVFQCADREGRLWFLTGDGKILQFADGRFKDLPENGGLAGRKIYTLAADPRGPIWAGAENEIARWNGSRFEAMTPTNGSADVRPLGLYPMWSGAMWVLDGKRLREMRGREWVAEIAAWRGLLGSGAAHPMGAHEDGDGGMWFNHYGNGLFHILPDGEYQRLTIQNGLPSDFVGAWFQGRDGGIWVGMDYGGLAHLRKRRFQVIGPAEGLTARTALSVCGDGDGAVWIGTSGGGLCRWRDGKITSFPVGASADNSVFSVFPRAGGGLWLSAGEGEDLYEFRDGQMRRAAWNVPGIKCILTDRAGRLWLGTKTGVAVWAGNERRILGTNGNALSSAVRALAETPDGTVWAGADDGTLYRCRTNGLDAFTPPDALAAQPIYSLYADRQGILWAGTVRGGLLRFRNGVFRRITAKQGLPVDVICQILEDNVGRLWLGTHQGLYCVSKSSLNACADGRISTVDYVTYGRHDGLPTLECSDGYQPACWRDADGRLWFTTTRGVVSVNPDKPIGTSYAPPVRIEELRVDGEPLSLRGPNVIVPPGHRQFDFTYTAMNFDAGEKTRFRYRIDGLNADWVDAGTQRTAHYGPLPPGTYHFRVMACNDQGEWNETSAAVLVFTVEPHFYQTLWFLVLATAGALGGAVFAARQIAAAKYRRQLARLEQQNAIERDRTRIAKDIHDDVGAGLTQITLLTELARREPERVGKHLERIAGSARQLTRAMDEIVWAVDPQHDTLDGLMDYLSAYAEDYLRPAGIHCRMDLPVTLPAARVEAELRHNLFLALKEALNNVVKHSRATEVWLRLRVEAKSFTLVVEDNGRGLPTEGGEAGQRADRIAAGSGLANLEHRLAAVAGRCEIHSRPGHGTRVEMTVALKPAAVSPVVAIGGNGKKG